MCVKAGVQPLGEIIFRVIMWIEEKLGGSQLQVEPYGITQSLAGKGTGYRPKHNAFFTYWQIKRKTLINNLEISHTFSGFRACICTADERLADVSRLCKDLFPDTRQFRDTQPYCE
ncbi:hypothetical protein [Agrobacterium tumefaciens]|uniref:hypothetical protein n=1 Tax=Agrobacterium tumefaciens TaxID=358 RepID=UPI00286CF96D|nr:hypothetical protein [Agrobacterium tumefaciens]